MKPTKAGKAPKNFSNFYCTTYIVETFTCKLCPRSSGNAFYCKNEKCSSYSRTSFYMVANYMSTRSLISHSRLSSHIHEDFNFRFRALPSLNFSTKFLILYLFRSSLPLWPPQKSKILYTGLTVIKKNKSAYGKQKKTFRSYFP